MGSAREGGAEAGAAKKNGRNEWIGRYISGARRPLWQPEWWLATGRIFISSCRQPESAGRVSNAWLVAQLKLAAGPLQWSLLLQQAGLHVGWRLQVKRAASGAREGGHYVGCG